MKKSSGLYVFTYAFTSIDEDTGGEKSSFIEKEDKSLWGRGSLLYSYSYMDLTVSKIVNLAATIYTTYAVICCYYVEVILEY